MSEPNFTNRTLWTGDNLDILRGMNSETVDLIYLDPPFNSNRDYAAPVGSKAAGAAFKDTWTLSDLDVAWMGLIADEHPAIAYILDASGRAHGKGMQSYLTMMAVRLLEMKRVLKPTGSIYLHCDPYASHYLKMLMDSIFVRGGGDSGMKLYGENTVVTRTQRTASSRRRQTPSCSIQRAMVFCSIKSFARFQKILSRASISIPMLMAGDTLCRAVENTEKVS